MSSSDGVTSGIWVQWLPDAPYERIAFAGRLAPEALLSFGGLDPSFYEVFFTGTVKPDDLHARGVWIGLNRVNIWDCARGAKSLYVRVEPGVIKPQAYASESGISCILGAAQSLALHVGLCRPRHSRITPPPAGPVKRRPDGVILLRPINAVTKGVLQSLAAGKHS